MGEKSTILVVLGSIITIFAVIGGLVLLQTYPPDDSFEIPILVDLVGKKKGKRIIGHGGKFEFYTELIHGKGTYFNGFRVQNSGNGKYFVDGEEFSTGKARVFCNIRGLGIKIYRSTHGITILYNTFDSWDIPFAKKINVEHFDKYFSARLLMNIFPDRDEITMAYLLGLRSRMDLEHGEIYMIKNSHVGIFPSPKNPFGYAFVIKGKDVRGRVGQTYKIIFKDKKTIQVTRLKQ